MCQAPLIPLSAVLIAVFGGLNIYKDIENGGQSPSKQKYNGILFCYYKMSMMGGFQNVVSRVKSRRQLLNLVFTNRNKQILLILP